MKKLQKFYLLGLLLPTLAFATTSQGNFFPESFESISFVPRLYAAGYSGNALIEQVDLLIPLYLTNNNALLVYGQGRYNSSEKESWETNPRTESGGLLYRQIIKNTAILGAYILGDYSLSYDNHTFLDIGPGLEYLGRTWDFHLNGYIPLGSKFWKNEKWAYELSVYDYLTFEKGTNNVYDRKITSYEEIGTGGDAEIGRKLFKIGTLLVKGYLQGYYYRMKHNADVTGGGIKITAQPSKYLTFSANNTFDNYQHNVFMLGAQIRLNDLFNKSNKPINENNLATRFLDPISRNFGNASSGTSTIKAHIYDSENNPSPGSIPPAPHPTPLLGVFFNSYNSGYVSSDAVSLPKGTCGNPYNEEDDLLNNTQGMQGIFNTIRATHAGPVIMFFAPGAYYTSIAPGNTIAVGAVQLPEDLRVLGRNYWYTSSTAGTDRALFYGSLQPMGNNYLESIIIQSATPEFIQGILIENTSNIAFNNIQIGSPDTNGYTKFAIEIRDSNNVTFNNSQIYAYDHPISGQTKLNNGLSITNSNNISLENNNHVLITTLGGNNQASSNAETRCIVLNNSTLNIGSNNTITGIAVSGEAALAGNVYADSLAINFWLTSSHLNITGNENSFNITATGGSASSADSMAAASSRADNVFIETGSILDISGSNNFFNVVSTGGNANSSGNGAFFSVSAAASAATLYAQNNSNAINITGNNNNFSASAQGGTAISDTMLAGVVTSASDATVLYAPTGLNNRFNITGKENVLIGSSSGGYARSSLGSASANTMASAHGIFIVQSDSSSSITVGSNTSLIITANGGQANSNTNANSSAIAYGAKASNQPIFIGDYVSASITANSGQPQTNTGVENASAWAYGFFNLTGNIDIGSNNLVSIFTNGTNTTP